MRGCNILEKGDFEITKNYSDVILISLTFKFFNDLLLNRIEPEIEKKIFGKMKIIFG